MSTSAESQRLSEARSGEVAWQKWGPYLSERQWGTVREDYSDGGSAWEYFPHDHARSRAYRWGEDGLAGICDAKQRLCFALALWNGKDPIVKERLFGLTNSEGNHGEDVKEYYFYLDSTPTHSYMKYLYKYPQRAYPYDDLVRTNAQRSRNETEYELLDTGVFDDDRYFDVFVEYAKQSAEDIWIRLTICNRGPAPASLHVLPTLWFRNTWSQADPADTISRPRLWRSGDGGAVTVIQASHEAIGQRWLYCQGNVPLLFTENDTNVRRLFGKPNPSPYVKDGINDYLIGGRADAVNPAQTGTKTAAHYLLNVPGGGSATIHLRLTNGAPAPASPSLQGFADTADAFAAEGDRLIEQRRTEADEFYHSITPSSLSEDEGRVMRQALAGMLWSKQYYRFDLDTWLLEHGATPLQSATRPIRNHAWSHMVNDDVISMPDKWEYPWYAAWDLAFHAVALAPVDLALSKQQLGLMLDAMYQHPSGQIPAYEWNFSDVNPPVHAWATWFIYNAERLATGSGDVAFLKRTFNKLLLNFTWWVNRKDRFGKNVFEGGFLGLDNIGVFDRSAPLPTGGYLEQADGTAWMAMFCLNMLEISDELASYDASYEDLAIKFSEHYLWIAAAMNHTGPDSLWDEKDGFYYDLLRLPDGSFQHLKVRSIVGLLPMCAVGVSEKYQRDRAPRVVQHLAQRLARLPELAHSMHSTGDGHYGVAARGIFSLLSPDRLRRILSRVLDENEFLSPYGIRALSRYHSEHPYVVNVGQQEYRVDYAPGESTSGLFGGNSNWRGPIWMPVNVLILRAMLHYYLYYGDGFKIECPTGSGRMMNLLEVSNELAHRLTSIFVRDSSGRRPVHGNQQKFQLDPNWRDLILFYEFFHGDSGAGLGASHQTGWTGVIGAVLQLWSTMNPQMLLKAGRAAILHQRRAPVVESGTRPKRRAQQATGRAKRQSRPGSVTRATPRAVEQRPDDPTRPRTAGLYDPKSTGQNAAL